MSDTSDPGTPTQPQTTVGDTNNTNNLDTAPKAQVEETEKLKKPKKKLPLFVAMAAVILGVIGVAVFMLLNKPEEKPAATTTQLTRVSMHTGWLFQAQFAGFFVAQEKGYYKDAGLDVDLQEIKDGQDLNKEVADGTIDFATSTPLEVVAAKPTRDHIAALWVQTRYSLS